MKDDPWAVGTFAGLEDRQRADIATLTPARRFEWLEEVLLFAAQTGALYAARERKQLECDAAWRI